MSRVYTSKTPALKATFIDTRNLDAKNIKIKGQNIEELWGLNLPEDYKKFITRCELPEDKSWAIWSDNGSLLYMNFSDKIINGTNMFRNCSNLSSFPYNLSSLTNGYCMFYGCTNLTSFTSDLSSLTNGYVMFSRCSNLTSFNSDLSSLTNGSYMFSDCSNLTTFNSDLSSLTDGERMFNMCSKLTTFTSYLGSLTDGTNMFFSCKLDSNSIENILTTIPTLTTTKTLTIGIQRSAASKFAEITGLTPTTTEQTVSYKGWNVKVKINN